MTYRKWGTTPGFVKICMVVAGLMLISLTACPSVKSQRAVVVYTSLDQPFSEPIFRDFENLTGIKVRAVYDVEAAKTTGLVNRLLAERERPQADVFWSSEYAQTILLKNEGALASYDSPSAADIPKDYRDPENYWTGFAARARVIIVNTKLVSPDRYPERLVDLLDPSWGEGEVGIANPLFGTTATHAAALFAILGTDEAKQFFTTLLERKVRIVAGNSVVRDMVVSGELKVGLTDTDDAYIAVAKGEPVKIIFPDQKGMGTLLIPNTVALIKGAPNPEEGKRLIDFLLSLETEAKLARSESCQIPVRETVSSPSNVPRLQDIRWMPIHPVNVAEQMEASSSWLKEVLLR